MNIFKKMTFLGLSVIASMVSSDLSAQMLPKMPLDQEVRYGVLPNGLTYYIRHNETPKGQADFYIAQKVGSILEEDNQRGLAHFLEHMCFNGTENFPGNSLIDYLESVGVKFGANLNAMTGVDQTIYNISNVPVSREGVQDSVLLILHDWADGLLLDPEEIDKERGVIHEEWRRSMVGQMRILEKVLPDIYPNSRYGYRLPIGTIEVIDNFKPQEIRDYYETWYRPDQQGIIVVGDIDVDQIETKIKNLFSPIKMPENPKPRVYFPVEDNEGTLFAIGTDPEQGNAIVQLMFKQDVLPEELRGTEMHLLQNYLEFIITEILNERLNDISIKPDAPFAGAAINIGEFLLAQTKDAVTFVGLPADGDIKPVLEALYREALRAAKLGFTQSEYDRAKSKYLSQIENKYNNRNNTETNRYVKQYIDNFMTGEPAPGIETEWLLAQQLAPMMPLAAINQVMAETVTPGNRVVLVMLPEGEGYPVPTPEELSAIMAGVENENIEAYVDEVRNDPFVATLPAPGKIVSQEELSQWGATEFKLSNGVNVIVKPTTFKEDEIIILARANGGVETYKELPDINLQLLSYVLNTVGFGDYSNSDVEKYLAGKKVDLQAVMDIYNRQIEISTTPKDLKTSFEVLYNYFTDLTIDENEFNALISMLSASLANQEAQPNYQFSKALLSDIYKDIRRQAITADIVKNADRTAILKMIKSLTSNAADYTIIIVGNVDMETLKPLLEEYVATLPADTSNITTVTPATELEFTLGSNTTTKQVPMQTDQTFVGIFVPGSINYTAKDRALATIAAQILSKRLIETVREDMGAVYSISAAGALQRPDINNTIIQSLFPMKPEMKDQVLTFIESQFNDMKTNVSPEEFNKVIEYMVKTSVENKEKNSPWVNGISGWLINNVDTFNGDTELYKSLTTEDITDFMQRLMNQGNYRVVIVEAE